MRWTLPPTAKKAWRWRWIIPYDLMILDIMLPKLDGLTLCRRVRAKGIMTPVLLLTARNTVEDQSVRI